MKGLADEDEDEDEEDEDEDDDDDRERDPEEWQDSEDEQDIPTGGHSGTCIQQWERPAARVHWCKHALNRWTRENENAQEGLTDLLGMFCFSWSRQVRKIAGRTLQDEERYRVGSTTDGRGRWGWGWR